MVSSISGNSSSSMAEMLKQMRQKMFAAADADGDGKVTQEELEAAKKKADAERSSSASAAVGAATGGGPSAADLFKQFDTDGDGSLSESEFDSGFQKLDEQMHSQMIGMQGDGQRPPPPPPPSAGANAYGQAGQITGSTGDQLLSLLDSLSGNDEDADSDNNTDAVSTQAKTFEDFLKELKRYTSSEDGSQDPSEVKAHMADFLKSYSAGSTTSITA